MNDDDKEKSHVWTWAMCLLALPVLYLLSVPPVNFGASRLMTARQPPPWAVIYSEPYIWLMTQTPLRRPLRRYTNIWVALMYPDGT